jgi:hypothetical protein
MNIHHESETINNVISLLDIFVIIFLEKNPILGIVLTTLLKTVTKDKLTRILLILLVIVLGVSAESEKSG